MVFRSKYLSFYVKNYSFRVKNYHLSKCKIFWVVPYGRIYIWVEGNIVKNLWIITPRDAVKFCTYVFCFCESIIFQSKSHALNTKSQYKIVFTIYCIIKIYFVFHFKTSQFLTLNFIAILNLYLSLIFLGTQNSDLNFMENIIAPLH